jgi:hypothetical protein
MRAHALGALTGRSALSTRARPGHGMAPPQITYDFFLLGLYPCPYMEMRIIHHS